MNEPQLSEEEIRQLQAELDRISVEDVLIQTIVTLLNVGARKGGLAGGDQPPDLEQTRLAIEGARALIPLLEPRHAEQLGPVKDMLAQLQMAFAQRSGAGAAGGAEPAPPGSAGGAEPAGGAERPAPEDPQGPGPARSSGRLWVPGQ